MHFQGSPRQAHFISSHPHWWRAGICGSVNSGNTWRREVGTSASLGSQGYLPGPPCTLWTCGATCTAVAPACFSISIVHPRASFVVQQIFGSGPGSILSLRLSREAAAIIAMKWLSICAASWRCLGAEGSGSEDCTSMAEASALSDSWFALPALK